MTRLQSEWLRLYAPLPSAPSDEASSLIDPEGRVRAMVLALARPADWPSVSALWQAVQAELALPAPAIAVSGVDAYQLWFSLAEAVPVAQAHAFLEALRARYLAGINPARLSLLPALDADVAGDRHADAPPLAHHAAAVPAELVQGEQWSAFVAPDLAPMFAETPWLEMPPSPEGQAELLARLKCTSPADWQTALVRLAPAQALAPSPSTSAGFDAQGPHTDPQRFLRDVMNDPSVALALRIEAAKALLPYTPAS